MTKVLEEPTIQSANSIQPPPRRFRLAADRYLILLVALSLFVLGPLFQSGYFWGAHDARHSVYFLFEFDRVFSDGEWYPRWMPDQSYGYGYPFWNIYSPGAYYVGEFLHLAGIDLVTCVKILFGASFILSGITMYEFIKRVFDSRAAAFVAGLVYVYNPYHLVDVYVRANLAESVALLFLPLTLWAFYDSIVKPNARSFLFAASSYAALVFAHNGIALFFSPVLGAWILFLLLRRYWATIKTAPLNFIRAGLVPGGSILLGLGIVAIFFIPLALEFRDVNTAQWNANYYSYADHFVEPFQLFGPLWGFGISVPGPHDGLSFQLGLVPLALTLFALFALVRNPRGIRPVLIFFVALSLLVILLMFQPSQPLWDALNLASFAQFPWRLLGLTMVSTAVLASAILVGEDETAQATLSFSFPTLLLGVLILLGSYPYITAQNFLVAKEGPVGLAGLMNFELNANELTGSTRWVQQQPTWSPLADNWEAGKKVLSKVDFSTKPDSLYIGRTNDGFHTTSERIGYNSPQDADITFYIAYYPGWHAYLLKSKSDEVIRELPIEIVDPYGQIRVHVPAGEYFLLLTFQDTPPRTIGKVVSALSLVLVAGIFIFDRIRSRRKTLA